MCRTVGESFWDWHCWKGKEASLAGAEERLGSAAVTEKGAPANPRCPEAGRPFRIVPSGGLAAGSLLDADCPREEAWSQHGASFLAQWFSTGGRRPPEDIRQHWDGLGFHSVREVIQWVEARDAV